MRSCASPRPPIRARAYDELAAAEPERWAVIDAAQTPDRVLADAVAYVAPLLEP